MRKGKVVAIPTPDGEIHTQVSNVEAIQDNRVYFINGHVELICEDASLLSHRLFSGAKPYYPLDGERFPYYFNKEAVLLIKALADDSPLGPEERVSRLRPAVVVMKSGNEYRIKTALPKLIDGLLSDKSYRLPKPPAKAVKRRGSKLNLRSIEIL